MCLMPNCDVFRNVVTSKLAPNSVTNSKIKDGSVQTAHIFDLTLTDSHFKNGAIDTQSLVCFFLGEKFSKKNEKILRNYSKFFRNYSKLNFFGIYIELSEVY